MYKQFAMLNAFDFMQQEPLAELQISKSAIFPAVLALPKINEALDETKKYTQAWAEKKSAISETKKHSTQIQKPEKSEKETTTYSLVYYNPESKKTEVIDESITLNYGDEIQQTIEEGLGQRSALGMYSLVATPIIKQEIDELKLKEILDKIKIDSPSPFGGAAPIIITQDVLSPKIIEKYGEEIIALELAEEKKLSIEERLTAQIQVMDEAIKNFDLNSKDSAKFVNLAELPPLTKARMIALIKKKKISKREIKSLLLKDIYFLKAVKQKIGVMRIQDIFSVVLTFIPRSL